MEKITLINGNHQPYELDLPKIVIIEGDKWNDVARKHLEDTIGLTFVPCMNGIEAQPTDSKQIVTLLMTYNFKSRYYNNMSRENRLILKSDYHIGWEVNSICYDCCVHNGIHTGNMEHSDRLSC